MKSAGAKVRWAQVKAVVRLEMRKTFFARRGLWIYVLAALPVFLFVAYALAQAKLSASDRGYRAAGREAADLSGSVSGKPGMTREELVGILGKPPEAFHRTEHRDENRRRVDGAEGNEAEQSAATVLHEDYHYADGLNDLFVGMEDGKVQSVNIREGSNPGQESIMFAGVFQFFSCGWRFVSDAWEFS